MSSDDGGGWQFDAEDVEDDEVAAEDAEDDGDAEPWRFSVADVSEEEEADGSNAGGNVLGSMDSDIEVVEAGSPDLENVLFVALGVVISLFVIGQFLILVT